MSHGNKIQAAVFLTNECPLRCSYCLTGNMKLRERKVANVEFVKQGLRDFMAKYGFIDFRFYGTGEPTTAWAELQEITKWIREQPVMSHIELQTCGYWSSERTEWIAKNMDTIWVSLDGPFDVHRKLRRCATGEDSLPVILCNLEELLSYRNTVGRPFVGVRPTITQANVDRMPEMLTEYQRLGVDTVWMHHAFAAVSDKEDLHTKNKLERLELLHFAERYVEAYHIGHELGIWVGNFLIVNFDGQTPYGCRTCSSAPHFTADGFVSACDMAYHKDTPLKQLIVGAWDGLKVSYNQENIDRLSRRRLGNLPDCDICTAKKWCAGGCVGETYYATGKIDGIRPGHCEAVRYLADRMPTPLFIPRHHP